MKFVVLLGPADTTQLTLASFTWDTLSCPIPLLTRSGNLSVNTCRVGAMRLVNSGPEALLRVVRPNPSGSSIDIDYQLIEHGMTRISLFDMHGKEAVRLLDTKQSPGAYSLHFDVSALPDGTYLCILQTPTQQFSRVFQVKR